MTTCRFLQGDNLAPSTAAKARALIGQRVTYLKTSDIDRSGRGYIFPRSGRVEGVTGRNLLIDGNYIALSALEELVLIPSDER